MPIIHVIIVLIIIGVLLWLINFIPMAGSIKTIINVVVVICVILWLLEIFGILRSFSGVRVGR